MNRYLVFIGIKEKSFKEYFEVIEKNEIVKKAFENIKQICIDLQKQTNCPEEDLKDFLEFISKQWNK